MISGKKTIKSNFVGDIKRLKIMMKTTNKPFDGDGYAFKKALTECKKEGVVFTRDSIGMYHRKTESIK